jgi:glycosyltransferase involved in cell wall biosynthesis
VVLPSRTLLAIAQEIWRLPRQRLLYLPNGIDVGRFDEAEGSPLAAMLGIPDWLPLVGTVATLRAEKNLSRLVEAFALVVKQRSARLVIVGDGPDRLAIEAKAASLGIAGYVHFTGAHPAPERLLPAFAVFALSSDTEQMPISILEAMAAQRAVASTDVGDIKAMLAPDNRPFVVATEAGSLAEAILALLADPSLRDAIGTANRRRVGEEYDQNRMFAAYRALFDGRSPASAPVPRRPCQAVLGPFGQEDRVR